MVLATHIQAACARLNFAASSAWESNHRQGVIRVAVICIIHSVDVLASATLRGIGEPFRPRPSDDNRLRGAISPVQPS
jgi:hypothetical protein